MPRFYFDFDDGKRILRDDDGLELPGRDAACEEMRRTLLEISKDGPFDEEAPYKLIGMVRDGDGVFWRGRLSFDADLVPTPA